MSENRRKQAENSQGIDDGIILSQVALELLAWVILLFQLLSRSAPQENDVGRRVARNGAHHWRLPSASDTASKNFRKMSGRAT